jgi:broad specificity phosphatase PhoE
MRNTLLFIRHAETEMAGRFCGHSDPPVNERGHRQIETLLDVRRSESIDAIYTSDLERALTTAEAIAARFQLPTVVVPELREIYFGDWEGLSWEQIETRDMAYARKWSESYPLSPAPGGESFEAFRSRIMAKLKHLLTLLDHNCFAIVTHAGVMRIVLRELCGLDEKDAWERTRSYCSFFRYNHGEAR